MAGIQSKPELSSAAEAPARPAPPAGLGALLGDITKGITLNKAADRVLNDNEPPSGKGAGGGLAAALKKAMAQHRDNLAMVDSDDESGSSDDGEWADDSDSSDED